MNDGSYITQLKTPAVKGQKNAAARIKREGFSVDVFDSFRVFFCSGPG